MKKRVEDWEATGKCLMINLKQRVSMMTRMSLRRRSKELLTLITTMTMR
jgi:hypothetical protein